MKFLTLYWTSKGFKEVDFFKDCGGIPFALAKYHNYQSELIYVDNISCDLKNHRYQRYVKVKHIYFGHKEIKKYWLICKEIWKNAKNFDVINIYYIRKMGILISFIAKFRNPKIIVYAKLDLGRNFFDAQINKKNLLSRKIKNYLLGHLSTKIDLYTVETAQYVEPLNKLERFNGKVKYLPNGFFSDLLNTDINAPKEKIILTVGRLGTEEKNTEMLIEAIKLMDRRKLDGWKVYLVGPVTDVFKQWYENELQKRPDLKEIFTMTGNISDKKELYEIYAKSSVFVLTSRWESWGLVVTEAAHLKNYLIVTDCCDAFYEYINTDRENGFGKIIEKENIKMLKEALEEVLDEKVDFISKGIQAGNFVDNKFDWARIVGILDNYFKEIYENRQCN